MGSTYIEDWDSDRYPDFVAERTGDQKAIMGAICAAKKASFDGVDCVGEDPAATGTVRASWSPAWWCSFCVCNENGVFCCAFRRRQSLVLQSPVVVNIYSSVVYCG